MNGSLFLLRNDSSTKFSSACQECRKRKRNVNTSLVDPFASTVTCSKSRRTCSI
ncbi:hypothetical protein BDV10DRAFT_160570 [Aspergillus recurvatus]